MSAPTVTPPGHKTDTTAQTTTLCPDGEYRAEWKAFAAAATCDKCGENISAERTEQITVYKMDNTVDTPLAVAAGAAACCE